MNEPDVPDSNPTGASSGVGETILNRYRVEKVLGRGGMGEVLLARDTVLNRRVALKRLRSDGAAGATRRNAVLREARRASQVSDHRIAAIYDVLDLGEDVLIVMEYVDGTTLRARVTSTLTIPEFRDISTQCAEAVGAAHARGIIHRDIKPENLMLTGNGRIKVLDFGIARRPDAPEGAEGIGTTLLTTMTAEGHAAVIAGTPQYMSPEALYGGRLDQRADIFSLGTVFYELLTGQNPFAASDLRTVIERVMTLHPPGADELRPEAGPALARVVARMMAKDPAHRQASCDEVLRELAATQGEAVAAAPAGPARPAATDGARRRAIGRWAVGVAAVAAVVAASWGVWRMTGVGAVPMDRNLAVLVPVTGDAGEEFASFALGSIELLHARLQDHQDIPGFQIASFQEGYDEKVATAADARKVQGASLALATTLARASGTFRARLELWDVSRARIIASRTIETPEARPFEFLDRIYRDAVAMLRLAPRGGDSSKEYGVRGAGTLSFLLRGIGRLRAATTLEQARRAAEDLDLACRTEPDAGTTLAWLSAAQRRCFWFSTDRSWLDRAEASVREAISRDSTRAQSHRGLGIVLSLKRDDDGARQAFARACAIDPTDDESQSRLGGAYSRVHEPEKERDTYLSVIAQRPHCWRPYWWLATWQYRQGRVDESIQTYRELVRRAPNLFRGYANLGGLLVLNGRYGPAIDTLKRALTLRPTKTAFDNLGTAYFNAGRITDAIDAYNQSFQFGFAEYDAWLNLGDAYFFLRGREDQAAAAYAQAIRLGREQMRTRAEEGRSFNVEIPANLATVFPKLGEPDSARVYLRRALLADSTSMQVQYCAALVSWQLGEKEGALAWLARAVASGYPGAWLRDSPVFHDWRGHPAFGLLTAQASPAAPATASPNR